MHIGVLDWGIGGLDFTAKLLQARPGIALTYWSDSGSVPYGKLVRAALAERVAAVTGVLQQRGVTHVVVACNAASTVLSEPVVTAGGLVCTGVIEPAIAAAVALPARVFGVIGGQRTIHSGIYRRALLAAGRRVCQRVAQPLSAAVERGDLDSPQLRTTLWQILQPLRGVDALILACTHYTALRPQIVAMLPQVQIVDPAAATLDDVLHAWPVAQATNTRPPSYLTTGDPEAMRAAAWAAFACRLPVVTRTTL